MRRGIGLLLLGGLVAMGGSTAFAEDKLVAVELQDGSRLVGRVVAEDGDSLTVATSGGLEVVVRRATVLAITAVGKDGRSPTGDPNYSRLLFGPTGRPLKKGDGYFSDYELLFPGVAFGVTDNFTLAGGVSVIPGIGLDEQLFYVSPKVGFELSDSASIAVGALLAGAGGGESDSESAYIGFAVGTLGNDRRSFSLGIGLGDTSGQFTDAVPIVMLGGTATVSRHVALIGETWMFLGDDFRLAEQPFGIGVRLFGERLSADVGVILVGELLDEGFPLPWLSVTYHFGQRRSGAITGR